MKTAKEYADHFQELWDVAEEIWSEQQNDRDFEAYVSADYAELVPWLLKLREGATTFLEWGAGLGVMTIMASEMGFEAYGIESEPGLVEHCRLLASRFHSECQFAQGSFIPDEFVWRPANGEEVVRTSIDHADCYADLGMELRDFDVVYGYPWPTEHELYQNILKEFGCRGAKLLTYDAREGASVIQFK